MASDEWGDTTSPVLLSLTAPVVWVVVDLSSQEPFSLPVQSRPSMITIGSPLPGLSIWPFLPAIGWLGFAVSFATAGACLLMVALSLDALQPPLIHLTGLEPGLWVRDVSISCLCPKTPGDLCLFPPFSR